MPNLANTLEKMTLQDVYSLIYSVYKSEADRQTHENDNKRKVLLSKETLAPLDKDDQERLKRTYDTPSVPAEILVQKLTNTLCVMHNTTGSPEEIAKFLFLLEKRVQRAGGGSDTSYQVTTFMTAAMNASAILAVSPKRRFTDSTAIDSFALTNKIEIDKQQDSIYHQLNSLNGVQGSNPDLSLEDQEWLKTRNTSWDLFQELENKYKALLNYPGLHEPLKIAVQELRKLTPNPRHDAIAISLSQDEQTALIQALNTKAQKLTLLITPETQNYIIDIQDILKHETIKIHLTAYKTYLEKTYGSEYVQNSLPQKKYQAINAMLNLLHDIKFVPGRLERFATLLRSESETLSLFQSRTDPGISPLQWLKAIGHAIRTFFKKLVNSEYEPVSKGGELVASLNEILGVRHQPLSLPEKKKRPSLPQSHDIALEDMASEENNNVDRVQPGSLNNPGCTRATNPFAFYQPEACDSEMKTQEPEPQASNKPN